MRQPVSQWPSAGVWIVGVILVCVIWWFGPSMYVSVQQIIPASLQKIAVTDSENRKQISRLRSKVNELQRKNRQLTLASEADNTATTTLPARRQMASVIARPPRSPYDTLLLNIGRQQGVTSGAPVWWPPGIYVGKIAEVRSSSALVTLVSAPDERITGRIADRATIETVGQGGGKMQAVVPEGLSVSTSSSVVSDRYGVPYGQVVDILPGSVASQRKLLIRPAVPVSVIEYVYVGTE